MSRQFINHGRTLPLALPIVATKPRLGRRLGDPAIPAALHCPAETLPVAAAGCDLETARLERAFAKLSPAARQFEKGAVSSD